MSAVSSWILSITGVVLVGLLIEIILPNGRLNKILKSILAIFTILVIVSPIKNISFENFDLSWFKTTIEIDEDFVDSVNRNKQKVYEETLSLNLEDNGYKQIIVSIDGVYSETKLNINKVYVDLRNLVLSDQNLNINKYTNIVAIIKSIVDVSEDKIVFYE